MKHIESRKYAIFMALSLAVLGLVVGFVLFDGGAATSDTPSDVTADFADNQALIAVDAVSDVGASGDSGSPTSTVNLDLARERGEAVRAQFENGDAAEGVQVHGHWTIDIHEADGSFVSHVEFENALVGSGEEALAFLTIGIAKVESWAIGLNQTGDVAFGCDGETFCSVPTADVGASFNGENTDVVISGTVMADEQADIEFVRTSLELFDVDTDSLINRFVMTEANVAPQRIEPGQTATITVTITFS